MLVQDIMNQSHPLSYEDEIAMRGREKGMGALPVLENEKLIGIITERDFFKLIA